MSTVAPEIVADSGTLSCGLASSDCTIEYALHYRELGLGVLPLVGKRPATALIRRTHGSASTRRLAVRGATEEQVREWFSSDATNIGVFVGEPSGGLVVVDLDDCDFPLPGATLPLTPVVKTGRDPHRGYHLYYRGDGSVANLREGWGEVRVHAPLYVVAPPSVHPNTGRRYVWLCGLDELPLAAFSLVALPERSETKSREIPNNQIRTTKAVLLGTEADEEEAESWLLQYDRNKAAVKAMAKALGITATLGKPFACVLHRDSTPSASLHRSKEGVWLYHDFHAAKHHDPEWLSLAKVRARAAGRLGDLTGPELATWKLILLVEAGILPLIEVPAMAAPPRTSANAQHSYERFLFLLGCRWNYTRGAPAPFTRDFAAALSGVPERKAREGIDELLNSGAIYVAQTFPPKLRLFLPAGVKPAEGPQSPAPVANRSGEHS